MGFDIYVSRSKRVSSSKARAAWLTDVPAARDSDYQEPVVRRLEELGFERQVMNWPLIAEGLNTSDEDARLVLTSVPSFHEGLGIEASVSSIGVELHFGWISEPAVRAETLSIVWKIATTVNELEPAFLFDPQSDQVFEVAGGQERFIAAYARAADETLKFIQSPGFALRTSAAIAELAPETDA